MSGKSVVTLRAGTSEARTRLKRIAKEAYDMVQKNPDRNRYMLETAVICDPDTLEFRYACPVCWSEVEAITTVCEYCEAKIYRDWIFR